jgi:hypothetical protein
MKFNSITLAGLSLIGVTLAQVQPTKEECATLEKYNGYHYPELKKHSDACTVLHNDCIAQASNFTIYIWGRKSCVAAATCESPAAIVKLTQCHDDSGERNGQADTPGLGTILWSNLVGKNADNGDGLTQQKYVDFIYGTLSELKSTTWPASSQAVIDEWYKPLSNYINKGQVIPYRAFDDYLHNFGSNATAST